MGSAPDPCLECRASPNPKKTGERPKRISFNENNEPEWKSLMTNYDNIQLNILPVAVELRFGKHLSGKETLSGLLYCQNHFLNFHFLALNFHILALNFRFPADSK